MRNMSDINIISRTCQIYISKSGLSIEPSSTPESIASQESSEKNPFLFFAYDYLNNLAACLVNTCQDRNSLIWENCNLDLFLSYIHFK